MVEQDKRVDNAAARPLLAYAPEFLQSAPVLSVTEFAAELLAEREHRRRREELLRQKREMLEADAACAPQDDMQQRMRAVREELQARLEPEQAAPAPEAKPPPEPAVKPRGRPLSGVLSSLFGGGTGPASSASETDEVLETYGETRLAAVIREANARWEAEHSRANVAGEDDALLRTMDDIRANRPVQP